MDKGLKESSIVAVVLGDSYTTKLRPLTYNRPKVLLPLVNIPLIEYAMNGFLGREYLSVMFYLAKELKKLTNI